MLTHQARRDSRIVAAFGLLVAVFFLLANKVHSQTLARATEILFRWKALAACIRHAPLLACTIALAGFSIGLWAIHATLPLIPAYFLIGAATLCLDGGIAELASFPAVLSKTLERARASWVRFLEPALRDRQQIVLVYHIASLTSVVALLLACFAILEALSVSTWALLLPAAILYLRANGFWQEIIHIDSHTRFMRPRNAGNARRHVLRFVQWSSDWVLSQFFGMFPRWYLTEHVGNHHPEVNAPGDVETLCYYDRTNFFDFAKLCGRLVANTTTGWGMYRYLIAKNRRRYALLAAWGAAGHAITILVAYYFCAPLGTWLSISSLGFGFSLSLIALSDHGLADPEHPGDIFRNSYNVLWTLDDHGQYGARYHLTHHLNPAPTWGPRTDALARKHQETVFHENESILFHAFAYPDDLLRAFWTDDADFLYPYVVRVGRGRPTRAEWQALFARRIRPIDAPSAPAWVRRVSGMMSRLAAFHIPPPAPGPHATS